MIFKLKTHKEFAALQADRDALLAKVTELEAKVDTTKDYAALEADRNNIFNQLQEAQEQCNQHNITLSTLRDSQTKEMSDMVAAHELALATLKATYEKQISDLNQVVETESTSSESKAISILATVGVPTEKLPEATNVAVTPKDIYDKWQSLQATDKKAATEFYNSNRETIKTFVGFRG